MTATRDELKESAERLGWGPPLNNESHVDIYRAEPYSIMVEFSRDGMITHAHLFTDPPDRRQQLQPRVIASADKFTANKRRRVLSWFYHYKQESA